MAPAIVSGIVAFFVFAVTIAGTYVYDDFDVFALDARLRDPAIWSKYWTQSYNGGVDNLYRPLVSMTYAIQWWVHGAEESDAWEFHLVNVLLHAGVTGLVAELSRRLAGIKLAWIAGLLFAIHPIHVEAVANIVGRAELMCALGAVGALVLFLHRPMTLPRAFAIAGCFILALLSKEQGMLTPLLLLFAVIARKSGEGEAPAARSSGSAGASPSQFRASDSHRRATLVLIILITWTLAGYIVWRESILKFWWDRNFLDWTINPLVRPDADRWLMPLVLLGRYISLLVFPIKLSPDYGAGVIGWTINVRDPCLYLGIASIFIWLIWMIISIRRRNRVTIFALLSLATTYGIVSNFATLIGTNFAERLMYLPSVFFVILMGQLLGMLQRPALIGLMTILISLGGFRSFTYAKRWNDRLNFYQISLREQPRSIRLYLLLSLEQCEKGELEAASETAAKATELLPEYWESWVVRSKIAARRGRFDEAGHYLDIAAQTPRVPLGRIVRFQRELAVERARAKQ